MRRMVSIALLALFCLVAPAANAANAPAKVAFIIKATDSDFWQCVLVGARNYAKEHPDKVVVTAYGPKSEADIDKQVTILEDVISTNPAAIVIASTSSDATVPALEDAKAKGIVVVTIDNKVKTDKVDSFLATNNIKAGGMAAEEFVRRLKAKNAPLKGKVAIVGSVSAVQVIMDRQKGFIDTMKRLAPDIEIVGPRFSENDIVRALGIATDLYTAHPDLLGFFADNNHTGDGTARAVAEMKLEDKIIAIAFDSDAEEVEALKTGALKALVLQDPYGMGYKGVDFALKKLAGESIPAYVDTGATIATKENMDSKEIQELLDPMGRAK